MAYVPTFATKIYHSSYICNRPMILWDRICWNFMHMLFIFNKCIYAYIHIAALATDHQEKQTCKDPDHAQTASFLKKGSRPPCSREHQHLPHSGQSLRINFNKLRGFLLMFMASIRIMVWCPISETGTTWNTLDPPTTGCTTVTPSRLQQLDSRL